MVKALTAASSLARITFTAVAGIVFAPLVIPLLLLGPSLTSIAEINSLFIRVFKIVLFPLSDKFELASGDTNEFRLPPPYHKHCKRGASKEWLRPPLIKTWFSRLHRSFSAKTFDQPGRWMSDEELKQLIADMRNVSEGSLDESPTYGVFCENFEDAREALSNRLCTIVYDRQVPVAFTAIVFLPSLDGKDVVVHLGLTMIKQDYRGKRIQTPMMTQCMTLPLVNLGVLGYTLTSIAASPAGVGSVADQMDNVHPHYDGSSTADPSFHLPIARFILANFRHEFGTAASAVFDEETFVVRGSNDPKGGGAFQFIKQDGEPVSKYKVEMCNEFCRKMIDLKRGDEVFQVARVHLIQRMLTAGKRKEKIRQAMKLQAKT